ncbi:Protein Mpv17 [Pleodorina starrii]|uniref:Protein Mpv17 n=1 Tax=Pleodorina starrii TaxID=330485 RepID=A0A9W6F4G0_9CHLO|nr:Protein Mpv17 [Pleodorina starrii]GLC56097.1 Protein Mpv17 [Pleodorina starrii]GLC64081.1 Protein Mpv17 [Pleodorina starrii]
MAAAVTISGPGFNPFGRVWAAYERSLRRRPVLTQAASSALLWGLGDAMAQRIETRGRGGVDSRRVALTAAFGGAVIGPAGHGWYLMLESLVLKLGLACSIKSMLLKVAVDNLLYSPAYVLAFFAFGCMAIDGLSPAQFSAKMRQEFLPTMLAEAMVWPPYMCAVFSRVPVQHQLLAVNVATLFDVCFLSWMRTKDDAGQMAGQAQQQQQHQQQGAEAFADVVRSRDAAAAALLPRRDAPSDENLNLGRMALMAASATCSTSGCGGLFWGLRPVAPAAPSAAPGAAPPVAC